MWKCNHLSVQDTEKKIIESNLCDELIADRIELSTIESEHELHETNNKFEIETITYNLEETKSELNMLRKENG